MPDVRCASAAIRMVRRKSIFPLINQYHAFRGLNGLINPAVLSVYSSIYLTVRGSAKIEVLRSMPPLMGDSICTGHNSLSLEKLHGPCRISFHFQDTPKIVFHIYHIYYGQTGSPLINFERSPVRMVPPSNRRFPFNFYRERECFFIDFDGMTISALKRRSPGKRVLFPLRIYQGVAFCRG